MSKVKYSAVVLDQEDQNMLIWCYGKNIKRGWKTFCHHMTICFGRELPKELKPQLGKKVTLLATHIGRSENAEALLVEGFYSDNEKPHITLSVNIGRGGKPVDSNKISNWEKLAKPFEICGTVEEVR